MTARELVEASATIAIDQVLSELVISCTGCGASRQRNDLTAWQTFLDEAHQWISVALCRRTLMQAWDILVWQNRTANALLQSRGHTESAWLHVALAVIPEIVITSVIDGGVQLLGVGSIGEGPDEEVIALVRPLGLEDGGTAC